MSIEEVFELTKIDRWFLHNIATDRGSEQALLGTGNDAELAGAQRSSAFPIGSSPSRRGISEEDQSAPNAKRARRCSRPIGWSTPARRSSKPTRLIIIPPTATRTRRRESDKRKVMILGGGPNRIGQGIEFDYCCVHAAFALRELGFETIMVNSNPETVSTDYDTSDKLYFEPLTLEDVLNIYDQEKPEGVIVQFGGQTPLNLAEGLKAAGVPIIGTQPESIEMAEDRKLFAAMLDKLGLRQTPSGSAVNADEAVAIAERDRLSGAGSAVVCARRPRDGDGLQRGRSARVTCRTRSRSRPDRPVLVDRFLEDAIEVDVDCISDGETSVIGAIMEHIEEAGIHSGDSACVIPDVLAFATESSTRSPPRPKRWRGN